MICTTKGCRNINKRCYKLEDQHWRLTGAEADKWIKAVQEGSATIDRATRRYIYRNFLLNPKRAVLKPLPTTIATTTSTPTSQPPQTPAQTPGGNIFYLGWTGSMPIGQASVTSSRPHTPPEPSRKRHSESTPPV